MRVSWVRTINTGVNCFAKQDSTMEGELVLQSVCCTLLSVTLSTTVADTKWEKGTDDITTKSIKD